MKRENYLSWDEYFMGLALLSKERSKDPNTQVGACIVNDDKKIISIGYNGAPTNYDDNDMPWDREGDFINTKYAYVCHSELNAILNSQTPVRGCTIYVTLFPCNECAKAIIQAGIKKLIYMDDKYNGTDENIVAKRMLDKCGVEYVKYKFAERELKINL